MPTYLCARPGQECAPSAPEHEEGDAERGEEEVAQPRTVLEAVVCVPAVEGWIGIKGGRDIVADGAFLSHFTCIYISRMHVCMHVLLPVDVDGHEREAVAQGQLDEPLADAEHEPGVCCWG